MDKRCKSIYQIARENAGFTQEKSAEMLNISVESLRLYEYEKRTAPNEIVANMADIYGVRHLPYQHLRNTPCGDFLPRLEFKDFSESVLSYMVSLSNCKKDIQELMQIARDGQVDKAEAEHFRDIVMRCEDLVKDIIALKFAKVD